MLRGRIAQQSDCAQLRARACSTRSPEPIGGAWVKTKIFQPSAAGWVETTSSNHASCSSSIVTSCDVYLAPRKTVEPRPTSSVFSATSRLNCIVGLLCALSIASRLASSVENSSIPSRSWFPPITSYGTSNEPRNSSPSSWHAVVPAKSSCVSSGRTDFDSPRSPREQSTGDCPFAFASSRIGSMCPRPVP